MSDINKILEQAHKDLQGKLEALQTGIDKIEEVGAAGGGICKVTMNGKGEVRHVYIDPKLATPKELETLQDLLVVAYNNAKKKVDLYMETEMNRITGGLNLPKEFKLPR